MLIMFLVYWKTIANGSIDKDIKIKNKNKNLHLCRMDLEKKRKRKSQNGYHLRKSQPTTL